MGRAFSVGERGQRRGEEDRTMEWFRAGGWGMFPILLVGLLNLGSSAYYAAARGDVLVEGSHRALGKAVWWFVAVAVASDLIEVCSYLQKSEVPDAKLTRILLQGLGESLTPVVLGGAFLALSWLLAAVGHRRAARRVYGSQPGSC
ncbi:MAG: hypothetical protein NZX77_22900 [Polyangiaceae bacterium]|nr:hypothetical protein [Polyangiaceae bacterium]